MREAVDEDYKRRPDAYKLSRTTLEKFTRMIEGRAVDQRIKEKKEGQEKKVIMKRSKQNRVKR